MDDRPLAGMSVRRLASQWVAMRFPHQKNYVDNGVKLVLAQEAYGQKAAMAKMPENIRL